MKPKNNFSFLIIIVFVVAGFLLLSHTTSEIKTVKIGGQIIKVELVQTLEAQAQGLSGRTGLAQDTGMLFVFSGPGEYDFWMKDMKFPLDMIWIGDDLHVIYIQKNATPRSYPATFGPAQDAKYVLEVNAGFADVHNVKTGDSVQFGY